MPTTTKNYIAIIVDGRELIVPKEDVISLLTLSYTAAQRKVQGKDKSTRSAYYDTVIEKAGSILRFLSVTESS